MIWIFEQEYIHVIIYNKKKIRCSSKCEHLKKLYQNCIWWGQIHFFIYFPLSWIWLNEAEAWTAQFVSHECYSCYCIINSSLSWNSTQLNLSWGDKVFDLSQTQPHRNFRPLTRYPRTLDFGMQPYSKQFCFWPRTTTKLG